MANPPRILLVEDDGSISHILRLAMQDLGVPYKLECAVTADEALAMWDVLPYDLLLTDYNLRESTGLELITALRERGANMPTVLFTAYDTPQIRKQAQKVGVTSFVAKPFFIDEFVELTRSLLPVVASEIGA